MRNAAELRRDALATGTFANYVGDGASVPWQEALPHSLPLGFTFLTYKTYLDHRWPEAFRLHDWLYTPWSIQINATRQEADSALYEEIAVDSPTDAWIVYSAVRALGFPWWQRSQTGYSGIGAYRFPPDMDKTRLFTGGDP
jgi:hypothetical protein